MIITKYSDEPLEHGFFSRGRFPAVTDPLPAHPALLSTQTSQILFAWTPNYCLAIEIFCGYSHHFGQKTLKLILHDLQAISATPRARRAMIGKLNTKAPDVAPRKHVCNVCSKAFKRLEHCVRHQRARTFSFLLSFPRY